MSLKVKWNERHGDKRSMEGKWEEIEDRRKNIESKRLFHFQPRHTLSFPLPAQWLCISPFRCSSVQGGRNHRTSRFRITYICGLVARLMFAKHRTDEYTSRAATRLAFIGTRACANADSSLTSKASRRPSWRTCTISARCPTGLWWATFAVHLTRCTLRAGLSFKKIIPHDAQLIRWRFANE